MFRFLCNSRLQTLFKAKLPSNRHHYAHFFQTQSLKSTPNISISEIQHSPTVSYLMNSCGLSSESAISASKKVQIETPEKADSVLQLFKTYGFTETQITKLITKHPKFLVADPGKSLEPKLVYFESLGFSRPDLAKLILVNRNLLVCSLDERIIPNVNFLKTLLHTNQNVVTFLKRSSRLLRNSLQTCIETRIAILRADGVPDSSISRLLLLHPTTFILPTEFLEEAIRVVDEMEFEPHSPSFILAIRSVLVMSRSKWDHKIEAFMSFGWSKDNFRSAFKLQPMCMTTSEKKIRILMDFFVNKLGVKPSDLAKCPNLLLLSLEKRIIPRCSVLRVLLSKGLIDKYCVKLIWALNSNRKTFEKTYVDKYEKIAPEVVKAYNGEFGFLTFETLSTFLR